MILSRAELMDALRGRVKTAGSMRRLAAEYGLSVAFISAVLKGRKDPGPRLLDRMGYEPLTVYRPLPDHDTIHQPKE